MASRGRIRSRKKISGQTLQPLGLPPKCTAYVKARTVGLYRGRLWLRPGFRFLLLIGCTHIYVTVKPDNRKKAKGKRKGRKKQLFVSQKKQKAL